MTARHFAGLGAALVLVLGLAGISSAKLAGPHNAASGIGCYNYCHILPDVKSPYWNWVPTDIDDTPTNHLCNSCHTKSSGPYSMTNAPMVKTHSSLTTDNGYGNWTIGCTSCHSPHYQEQLEWINTGDTDIYLATGTLINYSYNAGTGESLLTYSSISYKTGWDAALLLSKTIDYRRVLLIPDTSTLPPDTSNNLSFQVVAIDVGAKTITVKGDVNGAETIASTPAEFGIIYGQLLRQYVKTPGGWNKAIKLYDKTADGLTDRNAVPPKGVCQVCHTRTSYWRYDGSRQNHYSDQPCVDCHKHTNGFGHGGSSGGCGTAIECHGTHETHLAHTGAMVDIACGDCHNTNSYPQFADGQDLTNTTVCNNCHSADGAADAKAYFGTYGSWKAAKGEAGFCGSCHDATPGNSKKDGSGANAQNIMGDKITYGYFVTGHGKAAGNYARLSWQDNSASGNPAANQGCGACHDLASHHFSNAAKRLKSGYENNAGNANCNQCHKQGAAAVADPQWFTSNADYQNSAHRGKKCTDCHDVHGTIGPYAGMTRAPRENLCFQCHTEGGVQNNTISGGAMANDIQQAFSLLSKHSLGATFTVSGQSYSLQCISCHNVHVVSGKFSEAATGKSPVSRFTDNLKAWGVSAGQKMADYDISGLYQTPSGDTPTGVQLPDYATFCSDCHNNVPANTLNSPALGRTIYPFSWRLEKHGSYLGSDYASLGELLAPYADGQMGSYGLSCTDCHEAHGSSNNYLVRTQVNNGNVSVTQNGSGNNNREWDSLCFRCHGPVQSVKNIHHSLGRTCSDCHVSFMDSTSKNCAICHSHGSAEMESDTVAPVASNLSPAYGAVNVAANTSLTLTLTDTKSGIDWSTLIINLEGNKGYAWSHYIYASPEVTKSAGSGPGVLNVTLTPNTAFGSVEVITVTAVVSDYAGNVMSAPVWSFTTRDLTLPSAAPVIGTPNSLSANSIRWNFTDTAATEDGFRVHDASHAVKAFQETPNVGYVDETGLSPNTEYARHVHAYNFTGDSPESAPVSAYTLPAAPNVTADKTVATWYTTPNVVFTNAAGFGTGGVQYYRYVWDQNATYAFNDTETHWSGGTLTKASTADGSWYLHLKSYSAVHASGGVQHFGPYRYDGMPPPEVTQIDPYVSYQVTPPLHSIYVYWYSVIDSGSGTAGYSIERAPDSSGSPGTFAEIMTWPAGGNTYIIDSGLSPNTKYWYRIRAYDNTAQYGAYSNYKSAVTYSAVPTSVTASDGTAATVNISWTHDGASSSYAVLRDGPYGSGTLIYTGAATSCQDVVTGTHTYYLYSRNSSGVFSAGYATDTGYSMAGLPTAPTMGVPSNVTTNSMRWNFTDNASNEIGFRLHNSVDTVIVEQATTNLSYLDETSMTANRLYNRHVHAYNAVGDSVGSAVSSRWTLSVAPNVTADKTTSTWYTTPNVVFTNAAGFGAGGLQYYRYVWNQNATYTFNNTETQWSSGTLTMTSTADGSWYLHVKSFNGENVANGTQSYGPFYYDGAAPAVSGLTPSNGAVIVPTNSTVKFTLSDPASGINWSTFTLQLSGSKGYSISYNSSSPQVTKTGTAAQYNVTVTPDASFSTSEVITVILSTSDAVGNALSSYAYSFTTAAGSVAILHPSGLNAALGAGLWNAFGQWATYLDSNDGGMTWVYIPGGSGVSAFYVDMDNLGSCSGVMNIRLSAYVSPTLGGTNPYNLPADFDIGYKTGTNLVWSGTTTIPANTSGYSLAQSPVYSTNSDGGALTCSDVNNLVVGFKRLTGMGNQDMVTEVYVEVVYNP